MKKLYSLYYVLFLSWPMEEVITSLTPTLIKFAVLAIVVPPIALWMLYNDKNSENPTIGEAVITFFTSVIFVWLGYEASMELHVPKFLMLLITFIIGIFSLPVIMTIKKHGLLAIGNIIDFAGEYLKKKSNN